MFSWTVISDVTRGITNTTDSVGTESITMSPVMTEIALELKTSGGRMFRHGYVAVRACVGWAVLSIVAEKMTLKALCQRASRSRPKSVGAREYTSGRREYTSAVREVNMLSNVSGNREGAIVRVG